MTDLEMTRYCAEAMGWRPAGERKDFDTVKAIPVEQFPGAPHYQYAPLMNDSEAMALVKRFNVDISSPVRKSGKWSVHISVRDIKNDLTGWKSVADAAHTDLNRAIVECVAKLHTETKEKL